MQRIAPPNPGLYYDVPFDVYLSWNCFSSSMVKHCQTGRHLQKYLAEPFIQTDDMRLGSLVDCLVLEPDLYADRFVVFPSTYQKKEMKGRGAERKEVVTEKPFNLNSNTCKQIKAEIDDSGKIPISEKEHVQAETMRASVWNHPKALEFLNEGKRQVSIVWEDSEIHIMCKGWYDLFVIDDTIIDLKTCQDASISGFSRTISKQGYHVQGAMYSDGYSAVENIQMPFGFIAVEKGGIFGVSCFDLDADALLAGRSIYKRAMNNYKQWKEIKGTWPAYSDFQEPISIPPWAIKQELGDSNHEFF